MKYILCTLAALLLLSCTNDEQSTDGMRTMRMTLNGTIEGFDAGSRASVTFSSGDKIYLDLGGSRTVATYSGGQWTVTIPNTLADNASGNCTAYYFQNATQSGTALSLSPSSVAYSATGTFSNTTSMLTVTATLRPLTSRIRFRGTAGTTITVEGLQSYTAFNTTDYSLSSSSDKQSLTVQSGGYTPYVYAQPTAARLLTLSDGIYTYTRTISSTVMQTGRSGYMDIPTSVSHSGWSSDGSENITVGGDGYDGDEDWNPEDKEPSSNITVGGDDYNGDDDWN